MNVKGLIGLTALSLLASAHADLSNGLVASYPLNGNTLDASGNGRSLTNRGAILTTNSFNEPNSAYLFNGLSNIMVETNAADSLVLSTGGTLSCWVNLPRTNLNYSLIRHDGDFSMVIVNQYGHLTKSFYVEALNVNGKGHTSYAPSPPLGRWCMLTATWDGTNFAQYINGQQQQTTQASSVGSAPIAKQLCLGNSTIYGQPLLGLMNNVRIYDRVLSAAEVQQLFLLESGPLLSPVKAFTVDYTHLAPGTNYQLQASADLNTWTNFGSVFTATSVNYTNTSYQRIGDWDKLFFRLVFAP